MTESTSAVEQAVQARIAAARQRAENEKRRRAELAEARRRGLAARHAQKLRNLANRETPMTPPNKTLRPAHCPACRTERTTRQVATTTINGRRHSLLQCTDPACELIWATRPAYDRAA